jgi:hypothetical protein
MNRYLVKMHFHIRIGSDESRFDEQLRLISASNEGDVLERALALGAAEEEVYLNAGSEEVRWSFVAVTEIIDLGKISGNALLSQRLVRRSGHGSYREYLEKRSLSIQVNNVTFA